MSSQFLSTYLDDADISLEEIIPSFKQNENSRKHVGLVAFYFRQRGLCSILLTGQADNYYKNAVQAIGSYLYFLSKATDDEKLISDSSTFFDAVNTGLTDVCKQFALLSQTSWKKDYEYEDDFLYNKFLMDHFFIEGSDAECEATLEAYNRLLNGVNDVRYTLCKSFYEEDGTAFTECFSEFLEQRQERIEDLISKGVMIESVWSWARYISTEGLALLRLAEKKSFLLDSHYSQIPELLRQLPTITFNPTAWQTL